MKYIEIIASDAYLAGNYIVKEKKHYNKAWNMFQDNNKDTRTKAIACLGLSQRLAVAAASIEYFNSEDNCLK